MHKAGRRRAIVWFHRSRAIAWVIIGGVSFPLGWANSVTLVWLASLYANVSTDLGTAAASDNRELLQLLAEVRDQNLEILARLPERPPPARGV